MKNKKGYSLLFDNHQSFKTFNDIIDHYTYLIPTCQDYKALEKQIESAFMWTALMYFDNNKITLYQINTLREDTIFEVSENGIISLVGDETLGNWLKINNLE